MAAIPAAFTLTHWGFKANSCCFLVPVFKKVFVEKNVSGIISQTKLRGYCKNILTKCLKCHPDFVEIRLLKISNIFPQQMLREDLCLFVRRNETPPQILYYSKNVNNSSYNIFFILYKSQPLNRIF